jgi:hypothetical protein
MCSKVACCKKTSTKIALPGLNRKDIQGDPFSEGASSNNGPVDQMLELPPGAMDMGGLRAPAPPKKPMSGNVQDAGGDFNGQKMMPVQEDPSSAASTAKTAANLQGGAHKQIAATTPMVAQLRCNYFGMLGTNV